MAKELFTPDWYPFFQRKFTSATQMFNAEEIGTYIVLLNYQWDNGGLPDDFSALCLLAKCSEPSIHKVIKKFEKKSDGLFWNKRLEEVRKEQLLRYEKRSNAGKAGGLAKKQSYSNAKAMNKQSPSIKKENKSIINNTKAVFTKPTWIDVAKYIYGFKNQQASKDKIASEAKNFFDYYESIGWLVGKKPMKNWEASARRWFKDKDVSIPVQEVKTFLGEN